jgi:serine/threonine protein kinase
MESNYLCMGCMSEKGTAEACPICGLQDEKSQESPLYLPPRTTLNNRYLVGRVLGYGGFGITYLAYDLNLQIKLAIKEYLPQNLATRTPSVTSVAVYTGDAKEHFTFGLEKFLEEARMLAKFNGHPCIISVYDFFKENGTAYLAMDYVEGITLKEYLAHKGGKISFETALEIMMPVMDALREVHSFGMLHRDISPDNIYITKNKFVKLLDFGAARFAMGEQSKSLSVILKPGYAPEEQYRSRGKQGPWSDVYAVGATIYRVITGEPPFEALDRLEEDILQPPSELGVNIPDQAEKALLKALAVRANDRFQTIDDFQKMLSESAMKPKSEVIHDKLEQKEKPIPEKLADSPRNIAASPIINKSNNVNEELILGSNLWVELTGGVFTMGDLFKEGFNNESPVRRVSISYSYLIGKYLVTFDEFDTFCNATGETAPSDYGWGRGKKPVIFVSWWQAIKYCNWLSQIAGLPIAYSETGELLNKDGESTTDITTVRGYRLPTETEWEFAARAEGREVRFGNGQNIANSREINFDASEEFGFSELGEFRRTTTPVGSFTPNSLGLYDMSGNVCEWCSDYYYEFNDSFQTNSFIDFKGGKRTIKGGSWNDYANNIRVACRLSCSPENKDFYTGFRIARTK